MNTFLKITASLLLLFNGIGALYGGLSLMIHPDGSSLQLSLQLLDHAPFDDYFIPGVILFIANGLFSTFTFVMLLLRYRNYISFVVAVGVILTGWISIQVILIQTINFLHVILWLTGVCLVVAGLLFKSL